jgi:hypothetical protein
MNKRDQIQQEINDIVGSKYGKTSDGNIQRWITLTKKVCQYTLSGELVATYISSDECAKKVGLTSSNLTKKIQDGRPYNNHIYTYEGQKPLISETKKTGPQTKPIIILNKNNEQLICVATYKDVANYLGLEYDRKECQKISKAVTGDTKTYRKQYILKFKEDE